MKNPNVTEESLTEQLYESCAIRAEGKRVLVAIDTSTISIQNKKNRIKDFEGLSRTAINNHGEFYGLKSHLSLVYVDGSEEAVGISHHMYLDSPEQTEKERGVTQSRSRKLFEDRESYRWFQSCKHSCEVLQKAAHVTLVMDREADIIELIDRITFDKTNFIIRLKHNRYVKSSTAERIRVEEFLETAQVKGSMEVQVNTSSRKSRTAQMEIRYEKVILPWAERKKTKYRNHPQGVPVTVVEVKEAVHQGYEDEPILVWRFYVREDINTLEEAKQVIEDYSRRWLVEEYFKLIKTDGYDIEGTELTSGLAIRKLLLLIMKSTITVQQLKASRGGQNDVKMSDYLDKEEILCIKRINKKLEGGTKKQQNPYPEEQLAYASWVIARLGGWKGFYQKDRPPGTKTFMEGLEKFRIIYEYT